MFSALINIQYCFNLITNSFNASNISGTRKLFYITNSNFAIKNSFLFNLTTSDSEIIQFIDSNLTINNLNVTLFFPILMYGTSTSIIISDCFFDNLYYLENDMEFTTLSFSNFLSFTIKNTKFNRLNSLTDGPVNHSLFNINKKFYLLCRRSRSIRFIQ